MKKVIQDKKIFSSNFEKMKKYDWTCMSPGCDKKCINSHVLQKNGILSQIATDNHIIEVKPTTIWEMDNQSVFKYQKIGINEGFTFPGFCSSHDGEIFKDIESDTVDFSSYKVQCLFSYRGLCQEIRRKQQIEVFLKNILTIRDSFSTIDVGQIFDDYKFGLELGIKNLSFFKAELEHDILNNEQNFEFKTLTRPYLEVCTSAPINIKEPDEKEPDSIEDYKLQALTTRLPTTFVSIFPASTYSVWIIGDHKKYPSSFTQQMINADHEEALSELLILRMEYWCMSNGFFNKYINPKMPEIKKIFRDNALNFESELESSINLFR